MIPQRSISVLVVDDHEVVQWGLRTLLSRDPSVDRLLVARDAATAVELARRYEPNVALVDVFLGAELGTSLSQNLRSASPVTRVLLMSGATHVSRAATRAAGAAGFIRKDVPAQDIIAAVRMVAAGMEILLPSWSEESAPGCRLSERENEILRLLAEGAMIREVAEKLYLSPYTVKDHIKSIYRKLGARNRADAVLRAERVGLLT